MSLPISGDWGVVISIMAVKAIADGAGELREVLLLERGGERTREGFTVQWTDQMAAYARPVAGLKNGRIRTPA